MSIDTKQSFSFDSIYITVEWAISPHCKLTQTENAQSAVRTIPSLNRWIYRNDSNMPVRSEFHELPHYLRTNLPQRSLGNIQNEINQTVFFWHCFISATKERNQLFGFCYESLHEIPIKIFDITAVWGPSNRFCLCRAFAKSCKLMLYLYVWYSIHSQCFLKGQWSKSMDFYEMCTMDQAYSIKWNADFSELLM